MRAAAAIRSVIRSVVNVPSTAAFTMLRSLSSWTTPQPPTKSRPTPVNEIQTRDAKWPDCGFTEPISPHHDPGLVQRVNQNRTFPMT